MAGQAESSSRAEQGRRTRFLGACVRFTVLTFTPRDTSHTHLVLGAAAVVEHRDDGCASSLVHGHGKRGGASAERRGANRREGGRGGDEGGECDDLGGHVLLKADGGSTQKKPSPTSRFPKPVIFSQKGKTLLFAWPPDQSQAFR